MTARRLTHLTARLLLTLPLAACAAQPGPGQASGRPDAPAPAAPAPAAAPAAPFTHDTQPGAETRQGGTVTSAPRNGEPARTAGQPAPNTAHGAARNGTAAEPRAAAPSAPSAAAAGSAGNGTAARGTSTTGTAAAGNAGTGVTATGSAADTAPATGAAAPAATPAAPDVVAPRATPGVATPGALTPGAPTPGATVPPVAMPAGSPTGSLLQTLGALILVLAVLGALAWFLKRYGPRAGGGNANLRVVGSLNLGGRERIMVVEVGNQWIVVGASPGRINALATLPRQDGQNGDTDAAGATLARQDNAAPGAHSFADWLKQTIDKRK